MAQGVGSMQIPPYNLVLLYHAGSHKREHSHYSQQSVLYRQLGNWSAQVYCCCVSVGGDVVSGGAESKNHVQLGGYYRVVGWGNCQEIFYIKDRDGNIVTIFSVIGLTYGLLHHIDVHNIHRPVYN